MVGVGVPVTVVEGVADAESVSVGDEVAVAVLVIVPAVRGLLAPACSLLIHSGPPTKCC